MLDVAALASRPLPFEAIAAHLDVALDVEPLVRRLHRASGPFRSGDCGLLGPSGRVACLAVDG